MSMLLQVPFYEQEKNDTCNLACFRMIADYHGKEITESELENQLERVSGERAFNIADIGRLAINFGFKPILYCYDFTWIFSSQHKDLDKDLLLKSFSAWIKPDDEKYKYQSSYRQYLQSDGELRIKVITIEKIEAQLKNGDPLICLVESRPFFGDAASENAGHAVIIVGYDDQHFYIHDPLPSNKPHAKGKNYRILKEELMFCNYRRYGNALLIKQ